MDEIFEVAQRAHITWRSDDDARRSYLKAAADVVANAVEELAPILTAEQGKPLQDSREEILTAAAWLNYYAQLDLPREIVRDDDQAFEEVVRKPLGVVVAITPWNYPITLAMWKIAPALRAGNTVVVKPSPFHALHDLGSGPTAAWNAAGRCSQRHLRTGAFRVGDGRAPDSA